LAWFSAVSRAWFEITVPRGSGAFTRTPNVIVWNSPGSSSGRLNAVPKGLPVPLTAAPLSVPEPCR
jgi:hypothetical protein